MSLIDVIVGVKNEEKYIKRCINSLQNQTISDINIIVVDGLSDDRTPEIIREIIKKDPRVKLLRNPAEVISSARNIGLKSSDAEYVAYIDGHCYADKDWLETLYNAFLINHTKYKLAGVGSTYASPDDDSSFGKTVAYSLQTFFGGFGTAYAADDLIIKVETVAFALYERSLLKKEGITYDESMTQCEDTDFNYQIVKKGYVLLKHPKALIYQYRRESLGQFFWQMVNYGEGRFKLSVKYSETLSPHHLIPLIFVLYILFIIICIILSLINLINIDTLIIILIPLLIYIITDFIYTISIVIKHSSLKHIYAFLIFPSVHLGYGAGFLQGLIML